MKHIFIVIFFLSVCTISKAQINALTDEGKVVTLFNDGTWKYADSTNGTTLGDSIQLSTKKYFKSKSATFLLKSKTVNVGVYLDPAKWVFASAKENEVNPEYRFTSKSKDAFAMMITEKTEIELDKFPEIALINGQKASPDIRITKQEYRIVNNQKVLFLEMKGTISGMKFIYYGYYFSNKNGTVQLLSYSTEQLFEKSTQEFEDFIDGFVVLN